MRRATASGSAHRRVVKPVGVGLGHGVEELGVLAGRDLVLADLVDVADRAEAGRVVAGIRRVARVADGDHVDRDGLAGLWREQNARADKDERIEVAIH